MTTKRSKAVKCPVCEYQMDAHTSLSDPNDVPEENSLSICNKCLSVNVYTEDLDLRAITQTELNLMPKEHRASLEQIIKNLKRHRDDKNRIN